MSAQPSTQRVRWGLRFGVIEDVIPTERGTSIVVAFDDGETLEFSDRRYVEGPFDDELVWL